MNSLDFKKNRIEVYWRELKEKSSCPLERVDFENRMRSMKKDLPAEVIEEMYQEVLKQEEKESDGENVRGTS